MSQWGQPGFQYPTQTGFPGAQPQHQFHSGQQLNSTAQFQQPQGGFNAQPGAPGLGGGFGSLAPQSTGFLGARPHGLQQPQQTGFPGALGVNTSLLHAQLTGFPGAQSSFQQRPPPPPVPPLPASYQQNVPPSLPPLPQQQPSFLNVNQSRFAGPSAPSFTAPSLVAQATGVGLLSQPTGFAGRAPGPLVPQVTGFVDPRLQMMSSSFMPANVSAPYTSGGVPQLAPLPQQQFGVSLQQSFQQHNQALGKGSTPKIPWALSKAEKKQYDQIFRAWDAQGTGFISGQTALEVFGQSGLERNDLARIWTLADADNRGKLNLAEFHVAMGLIYRRLNGNDIPDELPAELVPPSSRDLDTSVNFLKDILKNDTRARSPLGLDSPVSRLKERSFTSSSSFMQQGGRQDATVYKHEDVEPPGGFYQPRNRHVDRSAIRSRADDASPAAADLSSIEKQLMNAQRILDDSLANERSSDALDREVEDLRYRITRLQEDLEYVSKGPRTTTKDEERRRLERELVRLTHEEWPELKKKLEDREARREKEKREWARDRDRRNERFGRFGDGDSGSYSPASRYRDEERPYSRGAQRYDRDDRDYDHDRSYTDGDRDRVRDSDRERNRGLSTAPRTPPPPPPPASNTSQAAPPPPAPARSPAPGMKNMTPGERQAFIRAEAQRRLEERKQALGVVTPSSASVTSPTLDTTIEDRLAQEKKEAEEKAREAERLVEEREKQRREKLEAEKASKRGTTPSPTPTTTAPPPAAAPAPVLIPTVKTAPPPPKPRAPAPPPPRRGIASRTSTAPAPAPAQAPSPPAPRAPPTPTPVIHAPEPPAPAPAPVAPEEDPEDAALRAREEALRKKREERAALLRKLEEEEEEARKAEAAYQERRNKFLAAKSSPAISATHTESSSPVPAAAPALPASSPMQEEPTERAAPPPPAPSPPPAPVTDKPSNNPFSRLMKEGGSSASTTPPTTTANGSSNPFFRAQTAPPAAPPPPKSPGIPPPVKTTYHTAPKDSDDDWDDVMEKDENDSSDEELGRDTRMGLAQQLFGGLLPSRPQSAGPAPSSDSPTFPAAPVPPPPPSSVPPAPPGSSTAPAPTGDRGALLSAIQGGARLRKTVTNDRSGAATSGRVVGDTAPPAHISVVARSSSPPATPASASLTTSPPAESLPTPLMGQSISSGHEKRESIDWYNALAADANKRVVDHLPVTVEESEEEQAETSALPSIQISEHVLDNGSELMADIDLATEFRVRSLYPYAAQRDEDLDFDTNAIIIAHPSKSGGDWWYGTTVRDGKTGFFPQTYVQKVEQVHATALYTYESINTDELAFNEGDTVIIVDRSETDWWKAERDGFVFIVPATYLEVTGDVGMDISRHVRLGLQQDHRQRFTATAGLDGDVDRHERLIDVYSTPYTSPQDIHQPKASELRGTLDGDEEEDAYYSLDEEGDSRSEFELEYDPKGEREIAARDIERRRVLEAAGLVVRGPPADGEDDGLRPRPYVPSIEESGHDHGSYVPLAPAPSAITRSKSGSSLGSMAALSESPGRKRRPAPAVPPRPCGLSYLSTKDLPPIPTLDLPDTDPSPDVLFGGSLNITAADVDNEFGGEGEIIHGMGHMKARSDGCILYLDDAFERYETFKKTQATQGRGHGHSPLFPNTCALSSSTSRMSMSSFDTGSLALTSPSRSPAASVTPSLLEREREREGGASGESRTSQFLSFLGRHARASTPDVVGRDRKLVISGPILQSPTPSPVSAPLTGGAGALTRAESTLFGSSWASLVDRSALEEIPMEERKRQEAIFELISTEADYVRDVQLIVKLFYSRLIEVLDEKATATIFSNIEDILLTNTTFLSTLEERQRDCRLYIDRIGDLLEEHIPNMGVYLNYCVNQAKAGKALHHMRESNPALAIQLQNLREDPSARSLDLSSYLLVPMQRLTRYPLLIRQIMRYTDVGPRDTSSSTSWSDVAERQSISDALQVAERILADVNEAIRNQEGRERLREISSALWIGRGRLDLTAPTRHLGPRKLLKEGVLRKARSGRKLRMLLCNDILVLVDEAEKGLYRVPIPVNEIQIKSSRSGRVGSLIQLHLAYPRGGDTIVLRASNVQEAKTWKDAILDTSTKALEGIRNGVSELGET